MGDIVITDLNKSFGINQVLNNINLTIENGEFVAILGPSGCGKTTLLRMIAGFETVDSGSITIGGKQVSTPTIHLPPEKRELGIVFQNYALWPHMNVEDNVGFSLKIQKIAKQERQRLVFEALKTVEMENFALRRPADLSGGQRQRVALARCIAQGRKIVLLDEPLANLDVNLRAAMEAEFSNFHKMTKASLFYITHDQAEAMAMATRIAVMDKGKIRQFSKPDILYRQPIDQMVAEFIGNGFVLDVGQINRYDEQHAMVRLDGHMVKVRCMASEEKRAHGLIALHPEDCQLCSEEEAHLRVRVERIIYRGGYLLVEAVSMRQQNRHIAFHAQFFDGLQEGDIVGLQLSDAWLIPSIN